MFIIHPEMMLSNRFNHDITRQWFIEKTNHPCFLAIQLMTQTLICCYSYDSDIGSFLRSDIKFSLKVKNLSCGCNSIKDRHLNVHENQFKLMFFTIRVITDTEIAICKLLNSLLTIRSCCYIKQRIIRNLVIILKLTF